MRAEKEQDAEKERERDEEYSGDDDGDEWLLLCCSRLCNSWCWCRWLGLWEQTKTVG